MFHPSRRDTCFLALLRLGDRTATVAVGDAARIEAPLEQVDALWTRDAVVWWLEPAGSRADPHGEAWARPALAALGHADAELTSAVSGFQQRAGLVPDGLLGPRTRMALFAMTPGPRPRLTAEQGLP
jgi:murein L,D-transpeptidase YcbB/YkuD